MKDKKEQLFFIWHKQIKEMPKKGRNKIEFTVEFTFFLFEGKNIFLGIMSVTTLPSKFATKTVAAIWEIIKKSRLIKLLKSS